MKRTMAVMALGLCAATAPAGEWRLGFFAGANIADLKIEGLPDNDPKTAAVGGLVVSWQPGSDVWSVDLRPGYVGGGTKVLFQGTQAPITANYIELSLLVRRDLGRSDRARPYLLAGGAVSHLTSAEADLPTGALDIKDDFEGSDVSLRVGAGVRGGPKVPGQPFLEVEYSWGIKDLNRGTGIGAGVGSIHNRGLQIRGGVSLALGKK